MALWGPKSMDQEQWVEAIIKDILKSVKNKSPCFSQPTKTSKLPYRKVSYLLLSYSRISTDINVKNDIGKGVEESEPLLC